MMQIKILKDRPTLFGEGAITNGWGDCSRMFYVCYRHVQTFQNLGGPNALLAPSNENLGGPVPLVSTGSGPHGWHRHWVSVNALIFTNVCI